MFNTKSNLPTAEPTSRNDEESSLRSLYSATTVSRISSLDMLPLPSRSNVEKAFSASSLLSKYGSKFYIYKLSLSSSLMVDILYVLLECAIINSNVSLLSASNILRATLALSLTLFKPLPNSLASLTNLWRPCFLISNDSTLMADYDIPCYKD